MPPDLLAHRVEGDGSPLLLVNGIAMTMASWDPVVASLPGRRIIRCDLRGQLLSPGRPPSTLEGHAGDVARLLDHLGNGPVDVLATSFGAAVAVNLAAARSDLVRSLILVAAVDRATPDMRAEIARWRAATLRALEEHDGTLLAEAIEPAVYSPRWLRTHPHLVTARRRALATLPSSFFQGLAALLATTGVLDVAGIAAGVTQPALVAAAGEDRFMPRERSRALAELLPNGRFTVLPGLGHAAVIEDPEAVAHLVRHHWQGRP